MASERTISLPVAVVLTLTGLGVGGGAGGIIAPAGVQSSIESMRTEVNAGAIKVEVLRTEVRFLTAQVESLAEDVRGMRKAMRARNALFVLDPEAVPEDHGG